MPVETCFALIAAVDRYGAWLDIVREVEVRERAQDGRPVKVLAQLHIAQSPIRKDFNVILSVTTDGHEAVRLTRVPEDSSDRDQLSLNWSLRSNEGSNGGTRIGLEFEAAASFLPQFLPLGGVGDTIAETVLVAATTALSGS